MQTIWFDISHVAQLNFYLHSIKILSQDYKVEVTVLDRGQLKRITKKELAQNPQIKITTIGKHRGSKLSSIFEANLFRILALFFFLLKKRIDLSVSNGFHGSLLSFFFRFPAITFGDDPRGFDYKIKLLFADRVYYCLFSKKFVKLKEKAEILPCLKEWAYLSPSCFQPNNTMLDKYGLKPYEYFFVREVVTGSLNYSEQTPGIVAKIAHQLPLNTPVLLSLEDKTTRHLYPPNWILLNEPVEDIHSLIYFSKALVSSGDSMAREAAILGLPSFYVGIRYMAANEVLKELVDFYQVSPKAFSSTFKKITKDFSQEKRDSNYRLIKRKFIDINKFIQNIIFSLTKKGL